MSATAEPSEDLRNGLEFETTFYSNPKKESPFRFRATHMDGKRAPKVILCDDPRIQPGKLCSVRVASVEAGEQGPRPHRGRVPLPGDLPARRELLVDPILSKKLQALLESGLNILLDGPQGSGKTVLSRMIAKALGLEYVFFNCSSIYEATDFLATLQLRATPSGQAETVWVPTDILRALEDAREQPGEALPGLPRRVQPLPGDRPERHHAGARRDAEHVRPADRVRRSTSPTTSSGSRPSTTAPSSRGRRRVDPAQLDRFAPLADGLSAPRGGGPAPVVRGIRTCPAAGSRRS